KVRSGRALRAAQWYFVAATFNPDARTVRLYQELLPRWPLEDARVVVEGSIDAGGPGQRPVPLLIGGGYMLPAAARQMAVGGRYNGKIDSPRIFSRALEPGEIEALKSGTRPGEIDGAALVAAWDFSRDISSSKVTDTSR